ncbi:MAG TPA: D-alanine--D-alanine ligase family protein [Acidimicrobiales bacterium]|nr:D-alanine--D-alanine ligase family protein [Acidimicrobiales bacterium]
MTEWSERLPDRVRLLVLFGGRSAEREVSCVSAASVLAALDPGRYDVVPVGITPDGSWVLADDPRAALAAGVRILPRSLAATGPVLDPLVALGAGNAAPTLDAAPTVVLPLLHGPLGEDGTVQGLLELTGTAYVGAGVLGSALCMDKAKAKEVLAAANLPQARYLAWRDGDDRAPLTRQVGDELGWPVFVKPANLGSSVGISRVDGPADLDAAVDLALAYDEWLVVEEAVTGRELECGVLGNVIFEASVPGEIVPGAEFYDFDDKYSGTGAELVVPALLPGGVADRVRRMAVAAATALRVEGMARVDFFYDEGERGLVINEANTIPGFTPQSMFPRLWEASGVSYTELLDRLVGLALARHARRSPRLGRSR